MAITFVAFDGDVFTTTQSPVTDPPAGVQDGDIILAIFTSNTVHDSSGTPPTGWTKIAEVDENSDSSTSVFWKRASSEAQVTWTNIFATTETGIWVTVAYRGCFATGDPQDATATTETSTSDTAKDTPSIETVTANAMVIGIIGTDPPDNAQTFVWDGGIDERVDATGTSNAYIAVGDKILVSPGATTLGGDLAQADTAAEFTIALKPAASAIEEPVLQASETDTAQAVLWNPKKRIIGQAAETDAAQSVSTTSRRILVSWAEMSLPVGSMFDEVNAASETDLAQAFTRGKSHVLGRAYEQGSLIPGSATIPGEIFPLSGSGALPFFATPSFIVGQATETDFAQAILVNTAIGQAVEIDTAQAFTEVKHVTLGQALETDTAQGLAGGNLREAIVSWAEVSMPRGAPLTDLGQAQETELAQPIAVSQAQPPRIAAAGLIFMWGDLEAAGQTVVLGQATETELAQAITAHKTLALGQASETDAAQAVVSFRFFPVGQAEETDTAQAITAVGGGVPIQLGQTAETDLAQPVVWKIVRLVGQIEEVDVALDVIVAGGFNLGSEDCDDLVLDPEADFDDIYPSLTTYPSSTLFPTQGNSLGGLVQACVEEIVIPGQGYGMGIYGDGAYGSGEVVVEVDDGLVLIPA